MTDNVLSISRELFSVIAGTVVFFGAALAFAFKYRATSSKAGEKGHRPEDQAEAAERVSPDGFIDNFSGVISEAGGGVPFTAWLIMGTTLVCYFIYLFINWK